jgi:hypothetical protein
MNTRLIPEWFTTKERLAVLAVRSLATVAGVMLIPAQKLAKDLRVRVVERGYGNTEAYLAIDRSLTYIVARLGEIGALQEEETEHLWNWAKSEDRMVGTKPADLFEIDCEEETRKLRETRERLNRGQA